MQLDGDEPPMQAAQGVTRPPIILAYDDWMLGWSIRDLFGAAGYRLHAYPRPIVPFHIIKRGQPDLVVIEQTPALGGVGLPLLNRLLHDSETVSIPIVLYVPSGGDLPAPSARLRVVMKDEPILELLAAARELLSTK